MSAPERLAGLGELCCGCGACSARCPRRCIEMEPDGAGFRHPHIARDACVACAACEQTCPVLNQGTEDECRAAHWAYSRSRDTRLSSSSGGVFPVLARQVLKTGGLVVGAAFTPDCLTVEHVIVSDVAKLGRLTSSKYVQSSISTSVYEEVRQALRKGRRVLFSGTACQIAGLKAFLGSPSESEFLLCVEIVCHGTPSPRLWALWAERQRTRLGASSLTSVSFRSKRLGWSTYSAVYQGNNGRILTSLAGDDWYLRAFQSDASIREACSHCNAKGHCGSDLTIGDFWGIQSAHPEVNWADGVSLVIVRSEQGQRELEAVADELRLGPSTYRKILAGNPSLERPTNSSPLRAGLLQGVASGSSAKELMRRFPFRRGVKRWLRLRLGVLRNLVYSLTAKK